jgi:glycosyltransferase involved in cell wall biosynthesis
MSQVPPLDVTVGMPVYDDPAGLRRSVPTVFEQTWPGRIRLLIVDDGSGPDTRVAIESLASVYDGIEVIRNERNRGRPRARNQILEHASDGYLAWLDAGDLWHPRKLELQLAVLTAAQEETPDQHVICVCPLRRYFVDLGTSKVVVPDVQGDQLYNALMAALPAYLPTMVGPVEAFRQLGFDEQLLRRQDYDLLVRFLAGGGRVVGTDPDQPLFTYLKSDAGANARVVDRANRVIRAKHAPVYRRYGPHVAKQIESNQHNLVARFHAANGEPVQAWAHRMLARAADPAPLSRQLRQHVLRLLGPLGGPIRKLVSRARTALGQARGGLQGLAETRHRRIPALPGVGRIERATPALAATPVPAQPDQRVRSIDELEARSAAEEPSEVDLWLELEEAYRRDGRFHSAHEALRRGLGQHPGDHRLRARLVELLGLRREWDACVQQWCALVAEDDASDALSPATYRRVARSFRELDQPAAAFETASAGLQRWPRDKRLIGEVRQSRARVIDWAAAVVPIRSVLGPAADVGGEITDLGFLAGEAGPIEGDVDLRAGERPRVTLCLNSRELAATFAAPAADDAPVAHFSINCRDALDFLGDGDVITIESDGAPVLAPTGAHKLVIAPGYESDSAELFKRLKAGHVFTKFGRLSPGHTPKSKRVILALYTEVSQLLEGELGHTLYPFYGNLLGAIREHDFIGHDIGGFDVAFVSGHEHPDLVRGDVTSIARFLASRDFDVQLHPHSMYVRRSRHDSHFVDVNYAWFTPANELNMSYGWRHQPVTDRDGFFRPRQSAIFGQVVPVPGNAEAVLQQVYGEHWAVPVQGFDPAAGILRDDRYLMNRVEMEALEAAEPDRIRVRSVLLPSGDIVDVT